jgi:hypothetical protein
MGSAQRAHRDHKLMERRPAASTNEPVLRKREPSSDVTRSISYDLIDHRYREHVVAGIPPGDGPLRPRTSQSELDVGVGMTDQCIPS